MRNLLQLALLIAANMWLLLAIAAALAGREWCLQGDIGFLRGTVNPQKIGLCMDWSKPFKLPRTSASPAETTVAWELDPASLSDILEVIGIRYLSNSTVTVCWSRSPPIASLALSHLLNTILALLTMFVLYRHRKAVFRKSIARNA